MPENGAGMTPRRFLDGGILPVARGEDRASRLYGWMWTDCAARSKIDSAQQNLGGRKPFDNGEIHRDSGGSVRYADLLRAVELSF